MNSEKLQKEIKDKVGVLRSAIPDHAPTNKDFNNKKAKADEPEVEHKKIFTPKNIAIGVGGLAVVFFGLRFLKVF